MSQIEHADFTPSAPNFKTLVRMNFQGLTNFPYIEEDFDALTNYGLLSKVVEYLNEVISNNNEQNSLMTGLYNAYVELQNYINTYFDNLDIQEEINNKLDSMAESGELTLLIKNYVDPIQEAFENEINNTINTQNATITTQNENIAVLKARMDTFESLTDGSTTGDAELQDIRVGYNGYTYTTAGNSVRKQVKELHTILENNTINVTSLTGNIENGSISTSTGANQSSTSRIRTKIFFNVKQSYLNVSIKEGWKIYIAGYNAADISDYDKGYTTWFESDTTQIKTITSDYIRIILAKTDNSAITIADYTDDVLTFSYSDMNLLNNISINTAITGGLTFLAPLYGKFKRTAFITSSTSFEPAPTRISCEEIQKLSIATTVYAKSGYDVIACYFDDNDLTSYTNNSGWVSSIEIPANQYFILSVKKHDTSPINVDEALNIYTDIVTGSSYENITPYPTYEASLISNVLSDKNSNTITIGVITDTHNGSGEYYRNSNQAYAIDKLSEKIGTDFIIHLGDVIQGYGSSVESNKTYLKEYWEVQGNTFIPTLYAIGHHERYGQGGESSYNNDNTAISESDCVGICGFTNKYKNLTWSSSKSNYYFDIRDNVRIISLNSVSNTAKGFNTEAINFLQEALQETGKKVIVFSHVPARKQLNYNNAAVVNGTQVESILNNYNGTVMAYIHGHVHWDNIYKPTGFNYPFYSVCCALPVQVSLEGHRCDEGNPTAPERALNSYSQYCFDIFNIHTDTGIIKSFRFGAGSNRQYTP